MVDEDQRAKGDLSLDPTNAYDGDLQVYEDWKTENEALKERASMPRNGAALNTFITPTTRLDSNS